MVRREGETYSIVLKIRHKVLNVDTKHCRLRQFIAGQPDKRRAGGSHVFKGSGVMYVALHTRVLNVSNGLAAVTRAFGPRRPSNRDLHRGRKIGRKRRQ